MIMELRTKYPTKYWIPYDIDILLYRKTANQVDDKLNPIFRLIVSSITSI